MSTIAPPTNRRSQGSHKSGTRRNDSLKIYGNPLPILFDALERSRGFFDAPTRSVWVTDTNDVTILWRRGFFGKGNLSRSEPSWLTRQVNLRKTGGKQLTSEEMTAKRRAERKQFKLDRAKAIAAAAAEAEAAFAEGRVINVALSGPTIPSAATWKPSSPAGATDAPSPTEINDAEDDEPLEDVEHLQLSLPEAFFLLWSLECLTVADPHTHETMSLPQLWLTFQCAHLPQVVPTQQLQFDSPFLINYVAYHHYRSLGWVVKGGIKFCVDYLLYKRGPVFSHAEFAVVICPAYEDPADQEASLNPQNASPFTWSWLSTINRVCSQVQKTLILAYVTIPARSRVTPDVLASPACLAHYSVREVIVRRFIPARMRD